MEATVLLNFQALHVLWQQQNKKMIDILQEVVAVPLIGLSTDKIQFLQTPTVQAELEKLLDKEGVVDAWKVQKDNTLVVHSLSEPAAKRAAHVVQASVVEVQIPINVQSDLKQWKQEVEDIKKKKGGHVHVRIDSNKEAIFAIPKTNAKAIQEHVKMFHKYPDQKMRGTMHFSTKTGQTITTILGDITDLDNDVIVCSSIRTLSLSVGVGVGHDLVAKGKGLLQYIFDVPFNLTRMEILK